MSVVIPDLSGECTFTTQRSSGPGGQNVNKTETKVELRFDISASQLLSPGQKNKLIAKLKHRLSDRSATIIITCQESRSQLKNKKLALVRLQTLIHETLLPEIPRIPTTPPGEVKEKRMAVKKKPVRSNNSEAT